MGIVRVKRNLKPKSAEDRIDMNEKYYNRPGKYNEGSAYWQGRKDGRAIVDFIREQDRIRITEKNYKNNTAYQKGREDGRHLAESV